MKQTKETVDNFTVKFTTQEFLEKLGLKKTSIYHGMPFSVGKEQDGTISINWKEESSQSYDDNVEPPA